MPAKAWQNLVCKNIDLRAGCIANIGIGACVAKDAGVEEMTPDMTLAAFGVWARRDIE